MDRTARQAIVDTTSTLLETQGYHGTGLNQIVKESGAPRGSLYYYFPDGKEELAAEAIAQMAQAMAAYAAELLGQAADPVDAILGFMDKMIAYFETSHYCGGAPLAAVALETAATSDRLRAACADAYAVLHAPFARKLEVGGFTPERAATLATVINAAIEGAIIFSRTQQSADPLRNVRDEIQILLDCALAQSQR